MNFEKHPDFGPLAAELILNQYDLGVFENYKPVSSGFANYNAKIETNRGNFLFRVVLQKTEEELREEIELMEFLKKHFFPAAYPIPRKDGEFINRLNENRLVILFEFLDGTEPEPSARTAAEIGDAAGWLNALPSHQWQNRKNDLSIENCRKLIDSGFEETDNRLHSLLSYFVEETIELSAAIRPDLPKGLIHGDIYTDNTIFRDEKLIGILDFEEFCVDTLLFDLGNAIHGFCYRGEELEPQWLEACIRAYHKRRSLSHAEAEQLPWFLRWAAHGQISWHLRYGLLNHFNQRQFNRATLLMNRVKNARAKMGKLEEIVQNALH
ncbi:MAG: phosphotransferase [Balneolaceae bacterium]|nr:phosphotransferase [Balneolaceae bacterium]